MDAPNGYVMTFGKHKGRSIDDVPSDYLVWCLSNMDLLQPGGAKFNRVLWEIIRRRLNLPIDLSKVEPVPRVGPRKPDLSESEKLRKTLRQWYAGLSRRFHPDLGGSVPEMIVVNFAYDSLIELIEGFKFENGEKS
jgi:hypothetical protein